MPASLTDALKAAAATWQSKGHGPVVLSFGSSSAIAKQVEAGAPADIFASADEKWMKYLTDKSGAQTLVTLCKAEDVALALRTATGKTIEQWKTEWLEFLSNPR